MSGDDGSVGDRTYVPFFLTVDRRGREGKYICRARSKIERELSQKVTVLLQASAGDCGWRRG